MRFINLILILVVCSKLLGQMTPYFLTTIYFKDAIGNVDSIEMGFDTSANDISNPNFGETLNLSPFKEVFDVRAVNYFEYYNTTPPIRPLSLFSGRIVGSMEKYANAECFAPALIIFFIRAKYQPITISVKSVSIFQKIDCPGHNTWNFFSPDRTYHFIEPAAWAATPGVRFECLKDSLYTLFLDSSHRPPIEKSYLLKYEVDGKGIDSIFGVCFVSDQAFIQCDSTFVGLDEKNIIREFELFPNPAVSEIILSQLTDETISAYKIFDMTGRLVKEDALIVSDEKRSNIQISEFTGGCYSISVYTTNGERIKSIPFVKQ